MMPDMPWLAAPWELAAKVLAAGRLPAGLLIVGRPGTGREELALAIARARLCLAPDVGHRACETCTACLQTAAGTHPDLFRLRPEEPGKALKIDQIRELLPALALTSGRSGARCAIIAPADRLTTAAANALLKTLEEPSAGASLILVASAAGLLPPTVVSRCLRIAVPSPDSAEALAWLHARNARADWPILLALAGGAPLGAERLAADSAGDEERLTTSLLAAAEGKADPVAVAEQAARWPLQKLAGLVSWLVQGLLRAWALGGKAPGPAWPKSLAPLARTADLRNLYRAGREAIRLAADRTPFNPALARERLILLFVDALSPAGRSRDGVQGPQP